MRGIVDVVDGVVPVNSAEPRESSSMNKIYNPITPDCVVARGVVADGKFQKNGEHVPATFHRIMCVAINF
jgi:hypothetical protein